MHNFLLMLIEDEGTNSFLTIQCLKTGMLKGMIVPDSCAWREAVSKYSEKVLCKEFVATSSSFYCVHFTQIKYVPFMSVLTPFIPMHKCSPVIYAQKRRSKLQNKGSALLWHITYIFISSAVPMDMCGMSWWSLYGKWKWG